MSISEMRGPSHPEFEGWSEPEPATQYESIAAYGALLGLVGGDADPAHERTDVAVRHMPAESFRSLAPDVASKIHSLNIGESVMRRNPLVLMEIRAGINNGRRVADLTLITTTSYDGSAERWFVEVHSFRIRPDGEPYTEWSTANFNASRKEVAGGVQVLQELISTARMVADADRLDQIEKSLRPIEAEMTTGQISGAQTKQLRDVMAMLRSPSGTTR